MKTSSVNEIPKITTEKGLVIHTMESGSLSIKSRYLKEGKSFMLHFKDRNLINDIIDNHHKGKKLSENPYEAI